MTCQACATIVVSFNGEGFAVHRGMMLADFLQQRGYTADLRPSDYVTMMYIIILEHAPWQSTLVLAFMEIPV
jgi:hypothetical protein